MKCKDGKEHEKTIWVIHDFGNKTNIFEIVCIRCSKVLMVNPDPADTMEVIIAQLSREKKENIQEGRRQALEIVVKAFNNTVCSADEDCNCVDEILREIRAKLGDKK